LNRISQTLRYTLTEKCHELEQAERRHQADTESLVLRKDQLLLETKALKDDIEELRRLKGLSDSRLEEANERTFDEKRRHSELADEVARLRARLADKDKQCLRLRSEAERVIRVQAELEARLDRQAPVTRPATVQTD